MDEIDGFDLHAAWVRRAQTDLTAFIEALAVRLETALPGHVEIERKRDGLLSSRKHVSRISISTGGGRYGLSTRGAEVEVTRQHEVRGIVVRTETMTISDWLGALQKDLRNLSGTMTDASQVLHEFLTS
ncbi:MAG: hypothetical protein M0Z76_04395 [Gammaproteobacteria bacterium]|nr:hypothetical protein [Gammaproteobacteria bacterium]